MGRKTRLAHAKNTTTDESEEPLANREMEDNGGHDTPDLAASEAGKGSELEIISKEIRDLKTEIKDALRSFGETLRSDVKKDLDDFKQDIHQQLANVATEQQLQSGKINEAESRIEKLELWAQEANNALIISLREQKALQDKLTDLESRSRRNNLRIYGVTEGEEGESVAKFIQDLLRRELHLPEDFNFRIQRAHRSPGQKPADGAQPRPIIVNFLEFSTKEKILREVWKKKIQLGNRVLSFDHDYATEVVQKRKEYNAAKRILKEKGVRFQTPFTRMRIHWETGTRVYNSAGEVKLELERRGLAEKTPATPTTTAAAGLESRLRSAMEWQHNEGSPRRSYSTAAVRAKEKLQEYRRSFD